MTSSIDVTPTHYVLDGYCYRRVTNIVATCNSNPWLRAWRAKVGEEEANRILEETSNIGQAIHRMTELQDRGMERDLDLMLDNGNWLLPFWNAWMAWTTAYASKIVHIEHLLWNEEWGCAGRMDRCGLLVGDKKLSIWDIKTGSLHDVIGYQLNGYKAMYNAKVKKAKDKVERVLAIHMPRTNPGYLRVKDYTNPKQEQEFIQMAKDMADFAT